MNLPFSTHWPDTMPSHLAGQRTYFPEKIWASIPEEILEDWLWNEHKIDYYIDPIEFLFKSKANYNFDLDKYQEFRKEGAKIHTIRTDKRWRPGMMIDFFFWTGKPYNSNHFKFAPRLPAISVQKIGIKPNAETFRIKIDTSFVTDSVIETLSRNDGFKRSKDFFAWFNEDFEGSIIQWTDYKY